MCLFVDEHRLSSLGWSRSVAKAGCGSRVLAVSRGEKLDGSALIVGVRDIIPAVSNALSLFGAGTTLPSLGAGRHSLAVAAYRPVSSGLTVPSESTGPSKNSTSSSATSKSLLLKT